MPAAGRAPGGDRRAAPRATTPAGAREPAERPRTRRASCRSAGATTLHEHGLFEAGARGVRHGRARARAPRHRLARRQRRGRRPRRRATSTGSTASRAASTATRATTPTRDQVYVGADDGGVLRPRPQLGATRWTYHGKGAIERARLRRPGAASGLVYVATAADRVVALDAATGKWRWQLRARDARGLHHPRLRRPAPRRRHASSPASPTASSSRSPPARARSLWARSLATASDQFVDVDTTPTLVLGDLAYAHVVVLGRPLRRRPARRQRQLAPPHRGRRHDQRLRRPPVLRGAPPGPARRRPRGPRRLAPGPHRGRRPDAARSSSAATSSSRAAAPASSSSTATTGSLLELFNPGHGVCAAPTLDDKTRRLYVLSNSGTLYALDLSLSSRDVGRARAWPRRPEASRGREATA